MESNQDDGSYNSPNFPYLSLYGSPLDGLPRVHGLAIPEPDHLSSKREEYGNEYYDATLFPEEGLTLDNDVMQPLSMVSGMEWNGMEWNRTKWNRMKWNRMEWNGAERSEKAS